MIDPRRVVGRFWTGHFRDNPLILREMGLGEERPWWKSPMVWLPALLVVSFVLGAIHGSLIGQARRDQNVEFLASWPMMILNWCTMLLSLALLMLPIWIVARAWARDSSPAHRDQIGASPITLRQLVGARTMQWLLLIVGFVALEWVLDTLIMAIRVGPNIWEYSEHGFFLTVLYFYWQRVWVFLFYIVAVKFVAIGAATRLSLLGWRPVLTTVVVAGALYLFSWWPLLFFRITGLRNTPIPSWLYFGIYSIGPFVAIWVWWGLYRHVARVYGMSPKTN